MGNSAAVDFLAGLLNRFMQVDRTTEEWQPRTLLLFTRSRAMLSASQIYRGIHQINYAMDCSEKGGGSTSVGPAPPPRKENYATETCTTNENNTSVLEETGPGLRGRMTCCGESRKEATMPMTLLSTRNKLNIGTWNVRTMYESWKTAQVTAEMRRFNLAVFGLCVTRWTQTGQLRLTTGELILYSGHEEEDAPHSEGVGLLLRKEAHKALIGWEARGLIIITACFKTNKQKKKK